MAKEVYYSSSGSNTAPYDTLAKAATNINTAMATLSDDGDTLIIGDSAVTLTSAISDSGITPAAAGVTFTVKSLLGEYATCTIDANAAGRQINLFTNATKINWQVEGITFTNSAGSTVTGGGAGGRFFGTVGDVAYNKCRWTGFAASGACVASPWLIRHAATSGELSFISCAFDTMTATGAAAAALEAMVYGSTMNLTLNQVTVDGVTIDQQTNNQACLPLFRSKGNVTVDGLHFSDITKQSVAGSTALNWALLHQDISTATATIDNVTASNCDILNGAASGGILNVQSPYTVTNIVADDCRTFDANGVNGLGCVFVASGDSAQGTVDRMTVSNSVSQFGTAVYLTQGGGGSINRLLAYGNTAVGLPAVEPGYGGAVCGGGWGDLTVTNSIIYGNTADCGGGIAAHVHASATRAKTTHIYNCVVVDNTALMVNGGDGGNNMRFISGNATYPHTVDVANCISRGGVNVAAYEIFFLLAGGGDDLLSTVRYCNVEGGTDAIIDCDTVSNIQSADPLFIDSINYNYRLQRVSPCKNAGIDVSLETDYDNDRFNAPPSIGAYGFWRDISRYIEIKPISVIGNEIRIDGIQNIN